MAVADAFQSAFYSTNARNEAPDDILEWFIYTNTFWNLFSNQHSIVYGSRGSGKTLVSRMASHGLLSRSADSRAKRIVSSRDYVGVFVNTDLRFAGSINSPIWTNNEFGDVHFVWKFNLNCMRSICSTIASILEFEDNDPIRNLNAESDISQAIRSYIGSKYPARLRSMPVEISRYESEQRAKVLSAHLKGEQIQRFLGDAFATELFEPIKTVIDVFLGHFPEYSDTSWLFFIDEAEVLSEEQQLILNSFMRAYSGNFYLKIVTMPFGYKSHATNIGVPLKEGDDFSVVVLDEKPTYALNTDNSKEVYEFARKLFSNRITNLQHQGALPRNDASGFELSNLDRVLGGSSLLARKPRGPLPEALKVLAEHLEEKSLDRARELSTMDPKRFDDEVWRKVVGPIHLRKERRLKGRGRHAMDVYSGVELVVRCSDGVPRRMLNLFQLISREAARTIAKANKNGQIRSHSKHRSIVPFKSQNRILRSFSEQQLASSLTVPKYGPALNRLIHDIGTYFQKRLHSKRITTDLFLSFEVGDDVDDGLWNVIEHGLSYGLFFQNLSSSKGEYLGRGGIYRLSYSFAPIYQLYPTQGRAVSLKNILASSHNDASGLLSNSTTVESHQLDLFLDYKND